MRIRVMTFCLPAALVLCAAATAAAQQAPAPRPAAPAAPAAQSLAGPLNPTFELTGGYQVLHVPDQTFPFGLNVDGARHYGSLGLVAEVGFARDSEDVTGGEASATAWNLGAGGRWTGFNPGRFWPFVQVLLGVEILSASAEIGGVEDSDTDTSFMLQPGVGVNVIGGDGWGIVGQIDYRRTFFDEPENTDNSLNNQFRVFIGARMILD
jgi:Outer membrane protein beta-barrel domain